MIDIKFLESQNKGLKAQNIELQQENKRLNDIIDSYQPRLEELKELKAENETLRITREKLLGDLCITEESLKDYEEHYKRSEQQKEKYYQTLQEIKAIAEKLMADNLCNNCDGIGLDANCQDTGCPYYQMDAILQKITKAEEE